MSIPCLMLFTSRSQARIIEEGGSGDWVLDAQRARGCRYAICVRNLEGDHREVDQKATPHGTAFLVGEISDVVPLNQESKPARWVVKFSRFAEIDEDGLWDGRRNPVGYVTMESLGLDPSGMRFKAMPARDGMINHMPPGQGHQPGSVHPLTFAEARQGLAAYFGVAESSIEILVRG